MMNSAVKVTFNILKPLILTISFVLVVTTLLQLDLPGVQTIGDSIKTGWINRQFQLNTTSQEDLVKQGWVYFSIGKYDEARAVMEKSLEREDNISALYCLGLIDMKYGRNEEGTIKLERVASLSPSHTPTLMALGKMYFKKQYFGKANTLFERAVEADPTSEEARLWLGKSYACLNNTDKAKEMLKTVTHGQAAVEAAALLRDI